MSNYIYNSHSDLESLLHTVSRQSLRNAQKNFSTLREDGMRRLGLVPATGYHIYGELKLTKKLSSPESNADTAVCLRAIIATTQIADRCVREERGQLLEAQGEIIHAFLSTTGNSYLDALRLYRFAKALTQTVYKIVKPICGDGWNGFAMAADAGDSLILTTATQTQSTISLGACANRPAKKLAEGVASGTLSVRNEKGRWDEIDLLDQTTDTQEDRATIARYQSIISDIPTDTESITINFSRSYDKQTAAWIQEKTSTALYGHVLRADLDGFSIRVETAFRATDRIAALIKLAGEFNTLIQRAEATFQNYEHSGKLLLPWAGDCLNGVIFPSSSETFSDSQGRLPATFGAHWHGEFQDPNDDKWTLGIAGGDADECTPTSNGRVLIATIATDSRDFSIAVGWGCGMSLRAQEAKGARADDTVIPVADYRQLEPIYQDLFSSLPDQRYYRAPSLTPDKLRDTAKEKGRATASINSAIPLARPWYDSSRHA
jgi:hypothetical protein